MAAGTRSLKLAPQVSSWRATQAAKSSWVRRWRMARPGGGTCDAPPAIAGLPGSDGGCAGNGEGPMEYTVRYTMSPLPSTNPASCAAHQVVHIMALVALRHVNRV